VEYVPGGELEGLVDDFGPLPEGALSQVGADVVLSFAHAQEWGIIHRDVKPQNVLLDGHGSPKLADFGIARAFDTTHETHPGSYLGTTTAYSSPEQLRGERIIPKSDVYSLGANLYQVAVGRRRSPTTPKRSPTSTYTSCRSLPGSAACGSARDSKS